MSDAGSLTSSIFRFREENGRTYHAYRPRDKGEFGPLCLCKKERKKKKSPRRLTLDSNFNHQSPTIFCPTTVYEFSVPRCYRLVIQVLQSHCNLLTQKSCLSLPLLRDRPRTRV